MIVVLLLMAANSAADVVFKVLLFQYATGKALPAEVEADAFAEAFGPRK